MNSFGLDVDDMEAILSILSAHSEVETAIIYGSRARGDFNPGSDIDLVLAGRNLSDHTILDIRGELRDSNVPYMCDVIAEGEIQDENLKREIDATGQFFYTTKKSVWLNFPNVQKEKRETMRRRTTMIVFALLTSVLCIPCGLALYVLGFMLHGGIGGEGSETSRFVLDLLTFHRRIIPLFVWLPIAWCLLALPYALLLSSILFLFWKNFQRLIP